MNTVNQPVVKKYIADKRIGTFLKFGIIGASGVIVNNGMLWLLTSAGTPEIAASIVATETAIISNFIGNNLWTWKDHTENSLQRRFLLFQSISLIAGAITVGLFLALRAFTPLPLLVANSIAILITFIINFALNSKFTWRSAQALDHTRSKEKRNWGLTTQATPSSNKRVKANILTWVILASMMAVILTAQPVSALVSVSHMGYHPASVKTTSVFTHATSGTFVIKNSGGATVYSGTLAQAKDGGGAPVNCQGNNPCLIGDFSNFTTPGTYTIVATTTTTETSHSFTISTTIYKDNIGIFNEFFEAEKQQGSAYHADFNGFLDPAFPQMADGSYIMTAQQTATTMIRLGDAYRRNPQLFDPSIISTMQSYVRYLEGIQDAVIVNDPTGFRLGNGYALVNAFVPGPTNLTTLAIYDTGNTYIQNVPVTSLCGSLANTACINYAASFYKCQPDETCLNMSYNDRRGKHVGNNGGPGVAGGWYYEWSCYSDMNLQSGNFNTQMNPCMIYDELRTYNNTAVALAAYTTVIPAINTVNPAAAQELLGRAVQTHQYIKNTYNIASEPDAAAFYGAASFLLYDMTGNAQYLQDAYGVRAAVSQQLVSDRVRGNEYYWQEYVRHQTAIVQNGMTYPLGSRDPAAIFGDQIRYDYYNGNDHISISKSGERVYQVYRSTGFQNSRSQLAESIIASKAIDLGNAPSYAGEVADAQIAWITGNNGVQIDSVPGNVNLQSMSFIFGIGTFPSQFHSRLLMNTGYDAASGGQAIGMHDTGYQFKDSATGSFFGLDGATTILGAVFGGHGNFWHNETQTIWMNPQTFKNGKTYIPGWINGAYLLPDQDDIYNYNDDRNAYQFTETENDIVGTAIAAFAYQDARLNHVTPLAVPYLGSSSSPAQVTIATTPIGADIWVDGIYRGMTTNSNIIINVSAGGHAVIAAKTNYTNYTTSLTLLPGQYVTLNIVLNSTATPPNSTNTTTSNTTGNGTLTITTVPTGANVTIDGTAVGVTPITRQVIPGQHTIVLAKSGYATLTANVNVTTGASTVNYFLDSTSAPVLLFSSTNATQRNGTHTTFEAQPTGFTVQYDINTTIRWYVNNVLQRSVQSDRDTFVWTPDILYTSNINTATVKAVGNGQTNATFSIQVENYLNPYWQDVSGAPDAILHVFSNNMVRNFTAVIVELEDTTRHNVTLSYEYANPLETDWKAQLANMAEGNTFIRKVFVFDNTSNFAQELPLLEDRAHYRQVSSFSAGGGGGGGGGGGAGGYKTKTLTYNELNKIVTPGSGPQFIYAVFGKDLLQEGESVELKADVKGDNEVVSVQAVVTDAAGTPSTFSLSLVQGTGGYGTWHTLIANPSPGKHTLTEIRLRDKANISTVANVTDRSFYVVSETVSSDEQLALVYAILDKNIINPGDSVTIKLDARDYTGITAVSAVLRDTNGENPDIITALALTSGTSQYGTWQANVTLLTADTTYALTNVTLKNSQATRDIDVYNQRVYVNYTQPILSSLTGMATNGDLGGTLDLVDLAKKPLTPLIVGLAGMAIAMVIVSTMTLRKRQHT